MVAEFPRQRFNRPRRLVEDSQPLQSGCRERMADCTARTARSDHDAAALGIENAGFAGGIEKTAAIEGLSDQAPAGLDPDGVDHALEPGSRSDRIAKFECGGLVRHGEVEAGDTWRLRQRTDRPGQIFRRNVERHHVPVEPVAVEVRRVMARCADMPGRVGKDKDEPRGTGRKLHRSHPFTAPAVSPLTR